MAPTADRLVSRIFMHDRFQAIVPRRHPLARRRTIALQQFVAAGLIVRDGRRGQPSAVERELQRLSQRELEPVLRVSSTEALKEAVASGLGVGVVSELALHSTDDGDRIRRVGVRGMNLSRPLYCVRPTTGQPSKAATAFLCMLNHASRGSLPPLGRPIAPAKARDGKRR